MVRTLIQEQEKHQKLALLLPAHLSPNLIEGKGGAQEDYG
jgi:hypothetical protein